MLRIQYQRRLALGLAVTVALTIVLLLQQLVPAAPVTIGTVPTGASFNLAVATIETAQQANIVVANVQASGLPAFTRPLRRGGWRQVIVGPFVSIDEAEAAQRALESRGFAHARLLVDESIRRTPGVEPVSSSGVRTASDSAPGSAPGVVMVAGAGRVSLVLEMPSEPRTIATRRATGSVIEVDAGPVALPVAYQEWNAPDGVSLVNQISLGEGDGGGLRARVATPALTQSNVRVLGRRVYIDLWAADSKEPRKRRRSSDRRPEGLLYQAEFSAETGITVAGGLQASEAREQTYLTEMTPIVARVDAIEPFLMSAVQSPAPDVLAAVSKTMRAVQERLAMIEAPQESAATHDALIQAIGLATQAADPEFSGDRAGQARQALARFRTLAPSHIRASAP